MLARGEYLCALSVCNILERQQINVQSDYIRNMNKVTYVTCDNLKNKTKVKMIFIVLQELTEN